MTQRLNTQKNLQKRLEQELEALHIPGASIAVSHKNKVWDAAAGRADIAPDIPAEPGTLFEIGSITKVLTATLIVRLSAEGRIELDAPATDYLPDLKIDGRPARQSLTVRTLLDYTAGMEGEFFEDFGEGDDALRRYTKACADLVYIHEPGEMRGYNSTAYCIAGRLIEVVTAAAYETALTEHLLRPAGIKAFGFATPNEAQPAYAVGHHWSPEKNQFEKSDRRYLPKAMTASGARLAMTARELLRFGELHLRGGKPERGSRLLPKEAVLAMRTPYGLVPPNNSERLMGWAAMDVDGHRVTLASGATIDQNAFLIISPEDDFALSILANGPGGGQALVSTIGFDLFTELTGVKAELPIPDLTEQASDLVPEQIVGRYTNGTTYTIYVENDDLLLEAREKETRYSQGVTEYGRLVPLGGHRYGLVPNGMMQPIAALEFLFQNQEDVSSHISQGGRLFARLP